MARASQGPRGPGRPRHVCLCGVWSWPDTAPGCAWWVTGSGRTSDSLLRAELLVRRDSLTVVGKYDAWIKRSVARARREAP